MKDIHSTVPNSIRDHLASDSGFEDQASVSQKPKKIQLKIDSCADFPEKNCFVVFELDGKQVGKSKDFVQNF